VPAFTIDLVSAGQATEVSVFDPGNLIGEARPANGWEAEIAVNGLDESDIVAVRGRSSDSVIVAWLVTPCDRQANMVIDADLIVVVLPPRPGCDAVAIVRAVALRYTDPGLAGRLRPRLVDAPVLPEAVHPTPFDPPPTAEG
jgi:hypothetical protein